MSRTSRHYGSRPLERVDQPFDSGHLVDDLAERLVRPSNRRVDAKVWAADTTELAVL